MEKIISCCGLDCATCDARKATIANDNELRAKTAREWSVQFNATIITEMINCVGCRQEGVHFAHCTECEIRNCVKDKDFQTCGDCNEMSTCEKVAPIHQYLPEAIINLESLK